MFVLRIVGNQICRYLAEHSLEQVLFWMKWTFEEETRVRKENSKGSLTTVDRGSTKRGDVSYYFLALFTEFYKELARKQQIRMHEEFQYIIEILKSNDNRFSNTFKKNLLGVCARILCVGVENVTAISTSPLCGKIWILF